MTEDEIVKAFIAATGWKLTEGSVAGLRNDIRKGLRIAIPWAREQALREAAKIAFAEISHNAIEKDDSISLREMKVVAIATARGIYDEVLALIPSRPSQRERADEKRLRAVLNVVTAALRMHVNRDPKAMEATHDALGYAEQELG